MRPSMFLIAAALTVSASASAFAQGGGGGGGMGGGGGTGGGTGAGGGTGTSGGTSFTGGGTTGGATSFTGGGTSFTGGGTTGTTAGTGGGMRGGGAGGAGGTTFTPSPTNFLTKTWANPLYPGRPGSTNISAKTIGGFGQPSFGATGTTGRGTATANRGARTGTGTNTGTNSNRTTPAITYALEVKFPTPPIATPQFQAELQSVVGRSSLLKTPGNVRVEVVGSTVVLRGIVADDDEKRLVEGMVRLEPGVHAVQNELAIVPPKP